MLVVACWRWAVGFQRPSMPGVPWRCVILRFNCAQLQPRAATSLRFWVCLGVPVYRRPDRALHSTVTAAASLSHATLWYLVPRFPSFRTFLCCFSVPRHPNKQSKMKCSEGSGGSRKGRSDVPRPQKGWKGEGKGVASEEAYMCFTQPKPQKRQIDKVISIEPELRSHELSNNSGPKKGWGCWW